MAQESGMKLNFKLSEVSVRLTASMSITAEAPRWGVGWGGVALPASSMALIRYAPFSLY